jgi:hypothetical protein
MNEIEKRIINDPKGHKRTSLRGYYAVLEMGISKLNKIKNNPKQSTK